MAYSVFIASKISIVFQQFSAYVLTWNEEGGGIIVMSCVAAKGAGNTPPGTGWDPSARTKHVQIDFLLIKTFLFVNTIH